MSGQVNDRAKAARHLARVLGRGTSLDNVLDGKESPLCLELTYGCLRHYFSLAAALDARLGRPLRDKDLDVYGLMLVGAYQLQRTRIPAHAAINETVAATRPLRKPWAAGLVNGVLRKLAGAPPSPGDAQQPGSADAAASEHPPWLRRRLVSEYPDLAPALLAANNQRAPMSLRVNRTRIAPDRYRHALRQAAVSCTSSWLPESVILDKPQPAASLPGYQEGWFAVQDIGGQLVGDLMRGQLQDGCRVLDACAAPGGKLFHLLEAGLALDVTALDISSTRLVALADIAQRLGHAQFKVVEADATRWQGPGPFDFVLLDAPCSGTGTLRRHPDIKVIRTPQQVARAAALQAALLHNLWRLLRPGCTLLYCTCSLLAEENDRVVEAFLNVSGAAGIAPIALPTGRATAYGWQMLPTEPATDGFYLALLEKKP